MITRQMFTKSSDMGAISCTDSQILDTMDRKIHQEVRMFYCSHISKTKLPNKANSLMETEIDNLMKFHIATVTF